MVIGLLTCEVLENEMAHMLAHDPEIGKVTFVESDPAADSIASLKELLGSRLRILKDSAEFLPEPGISVEVLAVMLRVGLHMDKTMLRDGVKEQARILDDKSDVLMLGYGLCGNVLLDIEKQLADLRCPIVMPQNEDGSTIDDCVCLVLGGTDKYLEQVHREAGTWFVTPGWMKHWETLLVKELHCPDIATVRWVFKKADYKRVLMVDTGIGDRAELRAETEKFAETFGFYIEETRGTLNILERAFQQAKGLLNEKRKERGDVEAREIETEARQQDKQFYAEGGNTMSDKIFEELNHAVVVGDIDAAGRLARQGLAENIDPLTITEKGLIPAMAIVSEKYDKKEYYLPQMLLSSEAFYEAFNILKSKMKVESKGRGKVLIGVVEGDVHDIGKNLVRIVLEANGFVCIDMGRDVPIEDYLQKVLEEKPDFLMLSTLMTPTMLSMKRTLEGLVEEGLRDQVKVGVGGGPISWEFCKKIGADFYGDNEKEALKWAESVVGK